VAKETEPDFDYDELSDSEEQVALLGSDSEFEDLEESDLLLEEEKPLTQKGVFGLIGIGILSFFLFVIFLFPMDELVKSLISNYAAKSNLVLEIKDVKFPLLGQKSLESITIQPSNDTTIKSEQVLIRMGLIDLFQGKYTGDVEVSALRYDSSNFVLLLKSLVLEGKLSNLEDRIARATGEISINIRAGKINNIPELPLIGEVKEIGILKGNFFLKLRAGKLVIEKGNLDTTWFRISISGESRLSDTLGFSTLDLKMCAVAQEKFADERPDIAGMVALLPQENGKGCAKITGTLRSPNFDLPALTGGLPGADPGSDDPNEPVIKDSESTELE
jgi:hypothetical protein